MLERLIARIRGVVSRRSAASELDEELQFHLDHEIETNIARGLSPEEARRIALRDFGGLTQTRDAVRGIRTLRLETLFADARLAVRSLIASPRFTIVFLLTTALIVGGVGTVFPLVSSVLLRPLPYPAADRLMLIESHAPKAIFTRPQYADVAELQRTSKNFDAWALYELGHVTDIDSDAGPAHVQDMEVTPSLFELLSIRVVVGRALNADDAKPSSPDVAVISYELWQSRFGGASDVLGKSISDVFGRFVIVGVAEPGAEPPLDFLSFPIVWRAVREPVPPARAFLVIARLMEGHSADAGRTDLKAAAARLKKPQPDPAVDTYFTVTPLLDRVVGDMKQVLWICFGAVACVLLIGFANLVSLQMIRNSRRQRELLVRAALGASRGRLIHQLIVESVLLAGIGGAGGLVAGRAGLHALVTFLPSRFPRRVAIDFDMRSVLFVVVVSLLIGVVCGLIAAWRVSRPELSSRLNQAGRTTTADRGTRRAQRVLIATQMTIAMLLLVGAALLTRSFERLFTEEVGMREDRLWAVSIGLSQRYKTTAQQMEFWTHVLERVRALPQVEAVTGLVNSGPPLNGLDITMSDVRGDEASFGIGERLSVRRVAGRYFGTLGVPIVKGRDIDDHDTANADRVVVINERAASVYWPGLDPIGRRLSIGQDAMRVIGVVPTFKLSKLDGAATMQMYLPWAQNPPTAASGVLMVRASANGGGVPAIVRSVLANLDRDATHSFASMQDVRWNVLKDARFRTAVLLLFAGTATFLAIVGIVGLVSSVVVESRREIGVRLALGADRFSLLRVTAREAIMPALVGLTAGIVLSLLSTRVLNQFLYAITPTDPSTFVIVTVALGFTAAGAAIAPARHALHIDPVEVLRED